MGKKNGILAAKTRLLCVLLAGVLAAFPLPVWALQYVIDSELDAYFNALLQPLGAPDGTHVRLVPQNDINAFVADQTAIYVYAGLMQDARNSNEIQGVLAHELGHQRAHHLLQQRLNQRNSTAALITGVVLGAGAIAAGAPQAGVALATTGQAAALAGMLAFTRSQEREADQLAVQALTSAGVSPLGMADFFQRLGSRQLMAFGHVPGYLQTHPLPAERMATLQRAAAGAPPAAQTSTQTPQAGPQASPTPIGFERAQAKAIAISAEPMDVLRRYTEDTPTARYARAIALMLSGKVTEARSLINALLKDAPQDVFYADVLGQLQLQQGEFAAAEETFSGILQRTATLPLVQFYRAEARRGQQKLAPALADLEQVTAAWPWLDAALYTKAVVQGQLGRLAHSHVNLASYYLRRGASEDARVQIRLARRALEQNFAGTAAERTALTQDLATLETQLDEG